MPYAIKKRGFLHVYTTVQNNVVGEMKFLEKRVKNVVVPHGNLSSPNGNVLLSNSVGGSCKVTGAFNIFYFCLTVANFKNRVFSTINVNWTHLKI